MPGTTASTKYLPKPTNSKLPNNKKIIFYLQVPVQTSKMRFRAQPWPY